MKIVFSKGDVFHIHYGLQDHLLVKLLKDRPTICHFHGSDLRTTLSSKWGWIVRENLKSADKVLVSVPDILPIAKHYRQDAEYLPNPVDLELFKPQMMMEHSKFNILWASDLSYIKGTDKFIKAFSKFQKDNPDSILRVIKHGKNYVDMLSLLKDLGIKHDVIGYQPHEKMVELYAWADVVVTDLTLGYLHMSSLEAMACMRPVVQYINREYYRDVPVPPVVSVFTPDDVIEALNRLKDVRERKLVAELQRDYVCKIHNPRTISMKVVNIYRSLVEDSQSG
ncbi:MAG: glycosyltransferase family 4 protein [Nitrososphaerota archaeon]|nr:glycosyltransferase family 4 protein [Aigarchaeota archaeon]MDW8076191.1 glycosyltransferase family 4 protein [Nitrososphaerota archaeon]